jgi:hypothetical protein
VEPEVGIEPTTYRLQNGRYPLTGASTSSSVIGCSIISHTVSRGVTQVRVTDRVTKPVSIFT